MDNLLAPASKYVLLLIIGPNRARTNVLRVSQLEARDAA
jgi:hypothetical protein